jgi:DNA polymerase
MMTNEARQALRLRLAGAKASIKKLPKILDQLSADGRLRNTYSFYKAHTGRWAGKGPQLQNLKAARTKEEKAMIYTVLKMLENGEPVPDLNSLSLALRPLMTAPKGKKIALADFKSVENRALMWAAGCEAGMDVYRKGLDPYIDFASRMEGIDYSEVTAELRQQMKAAVLGAGFGLGGGQLVRKCKCACKRVWNVKAEGCPDTVPCPGCGIEVTPGMPEKTGLWRYAEMMGIDLSQEQAQAQVEAFRDVFYDVAQFWYYLEEAYAACVQKRRTQHINSSLGCNLAFVWKDPALRIVLPSGRELVYPNAFVRTERTKFGSKKVTLAYETFKGNWHAHYTYGGRICENVIQAIGVDLLSDAMARVEADPRFEIIGHTHDELITLADEKDDGAKEQLETYMSITEPWAVGLPIGADGYEGKRYAKS